MDDATGICSGIKLITIKKFGMTKIDVLKKDKADLENCIHGLANEISALQSHHNPDYSLIASKIANRLATEKMLEDTIRLLEQEIHRCNQQPDDEEQKKRKAEFKIKNSSYRVVRSSYPKVDN
jgi:hypothetical protein